MRHAFRVTKFRVSVVRCGADFFTALAPCYDHSAFSLLDADGATSGEKRRRENEKTFASDGLVMSNEKGDRAADSRYNHAGAGAG